MFWDETVVKEHIKPIIATTAPAEKALITVLPFFTINIRSMYIAPSTHNNMLRKSRNVLLFHFL